MNNQTLEMRKQLATEHIAHYCQLTEVARLAPVSMEHIVDLALGHDATQNRWEAYKNIKDVALSVVGYDASNGVLRSSGHYEVMMTFIDWLLTLAEKPAIEGQVVEALPSGVGEEW
jgi:hypothetical protein